MTVNKTLVRTMGRVTTLSTITTVTVWQVLMGPTVITVNKYIFAVFVTSNQVKGCNRQFLGTVTEVKFTVIIVLHICNYVYICF